jgi:hypothetical protein
MSRMKFRVIVSIPGVGQVFCGVVRPDDVVLSPHVRDTIETVIREKTLGMAWRTVTREGVGVDVQVSRLNF